MQHYAQFDPSYSGNKGLASCLYTADGRVVCQYGGVQPGNKCITVSPGCWLVPETGKFECLPSQPQCTTALECAERGINGMTILRR